MRRAGPRLRALVGLWLVWGLGGCAIPRPAPCPPVPPATGVIWLLDRGWHTEIGVAADDLSGRLAAFRDVFPGARVLMFGFGKRTFMTAKVQSWRELLMGPVPGPGTIEVTGLRVAPEQAYDAAIEALPLPQGGAARLSTFLWESFGKDQAGAPRLISAGHFPGSLFYASARSYNLLYTCNTWTADALAAAGFPMDDRGVVLAGAVLRQTASIGQACVRAVAPAQ